MPPPLRTLIAATSETPRLVLALQQAGYDVDAALAETPDGLATALAARTWDVLLVADAEVPAAAVIAAVHASQVPLPIVAVSTSADLDGAAAVVPPDALERLGPSLAAILGSDTPSLIEAPESIEAPEAPVSLPPSVSSPAPMPLTADAAERPAFVTSDASAVQALAEHLPIGLYQSTPEGRILFANEALVTVLGQDSFEALQDMDVRQDLGYPRDLFVDEIQRFGVVRNLVVEWRTPTGAMKVTRENARVVRDDEGSVLYYEGTMEDITADYNARASERRRNAQLSAIVRFAAIVDEAATMKEVYEAAVDAVSVSMDTPMVMLMARQGEETHCVAISDAIPEAAVHLFEEMHIGDLLPLHTQPVLLRDERASRKVALPDKVRAVMQAYGVRSVGSFPLIHHGRPHGAFIVLYQEPHTFEDEELQVAETLAWHIAGSLARHRAESSLRDSEACLRFIAENTAHVLYRLRYESGTFDYLSPAAEALTGYSLDELEAMGGLHTLVQDREIIQGEGLMQAPPQDGVESHYLAVYSLDTKGGDTRYVENNAYVWHDPDGTPVGMVGVLQDVTERKRREDGQAEEAAQSIAQQKGLVELASLEDPTPSSLIERAAVLAASLTDTARVGVWLMDEDAQEMVCHTLYQHAKGAHIVEPRTPLGPYQPLLDVLERHRFLAIEHPADPMVAKMQARDYFKARGIGAMLAAAIRRHGRVVGMFTLLHEGGARTWSTSEQDFAAAIADVIALTLERADRHAAEAAQRESDGRYRAISELASDYAFAVHITPEGTGRIAWATDAFTRITGYEAREVEGLEALSRLVHPESLEEAAQTFDGQQHGETVDTECRIVTKSGEERWVYHRARRIEEPDGTVILYNSGQDITERKQFELELIAAREAAEEMARLKSGFLANMSHEIRTPLTGILGYAGLLAEEVNDEQRDYVQLIEKSGRRLLDTLNSVLDLARLEASGVEPDLQVVDVAEEAEQAVRMLVPLAEQRGLTLSVRPPGEPARARLDRACFSRILTNLIGNAIKFTEVGHVTVEVEAEPADIVVHVRDSGVGIDAQFLPFLFDEFRQETDGQGRSHEGSGLGLAITHRLVELMGGAIHVESQRPGGSTFSVRFSRIAAAHVPGSSGDGAGSSGDGAGSSGDGAGQHYANTTPIIRPAVDRPDDALTPTDDDMLMINGLAWDDDAQSHDSPVTADQSAVDPSDSLDAFFGGPVSEASTVWADDLPSESNTPAPMPVESPTSLDEEPTASMDAAPDETLDEDVFDAPFMVFESDPIEDASAEHPSVVSEDLHQDTPSFFASTDEGPADLDAAQEGLPSRAVLQDAMDASLAGENGEEEPSGGDESHETSFLDASVAAMSYAEAPDPLSTDAVPSSQDESFPGTPPAGMLPADASSPDGVRATAPPVRDLPGDGMVSSVAPTATVTDMRPSILVIEDNDDTRMLLVRILQRNYQVEAVGDARSGLDLMNGHRFDGLVLDINLGGKQTGVDVLRVARSIEGYDTVFAIALTAYALPGDRERFLEAGFNRYVSKPFTRSTLMAALSDGVPVSA